MRLLAALLLISTVVFAQSDCAVSGAVVNSVTQAPVLRARLSVSGPNETINADTDQNGKWRAEHLTCGKVKISITRPGFLRLEQRVEAPAGDLKIALIPQAVLTGRVMDEVGDPIENSHVSLLDVRILDGVRGIQLRSSENANDLGEFRFSGLPRGRYILCANVSSGMIAEGTRRYGEKCSPAPLDAGVAGAAEIVAGEERRIDFVLPLLPTVRVSGVVSGRQEGAEVRLTMAPRSQIPGTVNAFSTQAKPDGGFSIRGVPSGAYTLTAESDAGDARLPVNVGIDDMRDLLVRLAPRVTVPVKVNVESIAGRTLDRADNIVYLWAGPQTFPGRANERNEFFIAGVRPGSYRIGFSPPKPFYVKSAALDGRGIPGDTLTVEPGVRQLEVTLRDDGGAIEGDVSAEDAPAIAWILLEKDGAPLRNAESDAKGHFKIDLVPPGDYKVYAWDDNSKVEYRNPEWMQRYGKPATVTIAPAQTAPVKLERQIAPA